MSKVILRNRVSTEYKEVEDQSPEFYALTRELHIDGRPRWEQTGQHDAAAFAQRLASNSLRETDIGDAAQPLVIDTTGDPDVVPQLDFGWPTPGELEQGAGRAAELDDETLAHLRAQAGLSDAGTGYPAGSPPALSDEDTAANTKEARLEKGVADNPLNTPSVPATTDAGSDGDSSVNWGRKNLADLQAEAESRGLEVTRGDGQEGEPLKADYVAAIEQDEAEADNA